MNKKIFTLVVCLLGIILVFFYSKESSRKTEIQDIYSERATTTITLPFEEYSTEKRPLPPIRNLDQILNEDQDVSDDYKDYFIKDVEQYGDLARRFIDVIVGIQKVKYFDVDMDGKDETIIFMCGYTNSGCPQKIIIVKEDKVIFTIDAGHKNSDLIKSENGNGFYVHWISKTDSTKMETRFTYTNGVFQPSSEKKGAFGESVCENFQDIQTFATPTPIVWYAKLDGCVVSCEGGPFTKITTDKNEKYPRFVGYMKEGKVIPGKFLDDGLKFKITGEWVSIGDDYARTLFGNECVPVANIRSIEVI